MVDEVKPDTPDEGAENAEEQETKGGLQGPVKLLLGIVLLVATGGGLALVALPDKASPERFEGPWMFAFFEEDVVGNTLDDNFSRYLKWGPQCSYFAYDEDYTEKRRADPHYHPAMLEAMGAIVSRYELEEVMRGSNRDVFAAELERVCEPILFPVHIGRTDNPFAADPASGLRPGESQERHGTFRRPFHDHVLRVDGGSNTIRLDDGPPVSFGGGENDLEVVGEHGDRVYVDVTELDPEFRGEVHVGVHGRIRRVYLGKVLAQ